ncbi:hypothetical protein V1264_017999 [Littorina saxatilis]|uniref:Leucine-rich repeat-containing protein 71 n=1 Tax=Littorina saxatilis TaxID=31220 RepID=A0AAN9BKD7_9CAEN
MSWMSRGSIVSLSPLPNQLVSESSKVEAATDPEDDRGKPALCGSFRADFAALCRDKGVQYVPEVVQTIVPEVKTESKKPVRKLTLNRGVMEQVMKNVNKKFPTRAVPKWEQKAEAKVKVAFREQSSLSRLPGTCSRTSTTGDLGNVQDGFDYFKPRVQVVQELENDDRTVREVSISGWKVDVVQELENDDRTVREVSISGWKVDVVMMEVLESCLPAVTSLRVLQLWRVGLSADTLTMLARCLPLCRALTSVTLDNNTLTDCPLQALLVHTAVLQTLSLRFCHVGDGGVMAMARVLQEEREGGTQAPLVSLCLTGNQVGDEGACSLALALTFNRVLRVLNLSANSVGDRGAAGLASACRWVRVTGDSLTSRRQRMHQYLVDQPPDFPKRTTKVTRTQKRSFNPEKRPVKIQRPTRRVSRMAPKDGRSSKAKGVSSSHAVIDDGACPEHRGLRMLKPPDTMWYMPGRRPDYFAESDIAVEGCGLHLLMQPGFLHDGDLWLPGNRSLLSLNLSRNKVGKVGVQSLMEALEEQAVPVVGGELGLQRVVLHHNPFPPDFPPFLRLSRRLRIRDPSNHMPRVDLCNHNVTPCAIADTAFV